MFLLNPESVTFGAVPWPDVTAAAVDRRAVRRSIDFSDSGPHPVHADAPEQHTMVTIVRRMMRDELGSPVPGDRAELVMFTSPAGARADIARRRIAFDAVVLEVKTDLAAAGAGSKGPMRTVTLIALSEDGAADPAHAAEFEPSLGDTPPKA